MRVEIIRRLVGMRPSSAVLDILDEAGRKPHNEDILKILVRSFGYLPEPSAFDRTLPYLQHAKKDVMGSAVRALLTLDAERAATWIRGMILSSEADRLLVAARHFIERGGAIARLVFRGLLESVNPSERLTGLVGLRFIPPSEGLDILISMLRRETDPAVLSVARKLMVHWSYEVERERLMSFRDELAQKLEVMDAALKGSEPLPEPPLPEPGEQGTVLGLRTVQPETDRTIEAFEQSVNQDRATLFPNLVNVPPPPVTAPVSAPNPTPKETPWQAKQRKQKDRGLVQRAARSVIMPAVKLAGWWSEFAPAAWGRHPFILGGLVAMLALYTGFQLIGNRDPAAGSLVDFQGPVAKVHPDLEIILMGGADGTVYSVYFQDQKVRDKVQEGGRAHVVGTLEEIREDQTRVVRGSSIRMVPDDSGASPAPSPSPR